MQQAFSAITQLMLCFKQGCIEVRSTAHSSVSEQTDNTIARDNLQEPMPRTYYRTATLARTAKCCIELCIQFLHDGLQEATSLRTLQPECTVVLVRLPLIALGDFGREGAGNY